MLAFNIARPLKSREPLMLIILIFFIAVVSLPVSQRGAQCSCDLTL